MLFPWANTLLLALLGLLLVTGFAGLTSGSPGDAWVLALHSAGAYAVVVVLFWKSRIILNVVLRRPLTAARAAFLGLTALLLGILATGLVWTHAGTAYLYGFSLMTVHALLAVVLTALLAWHVLARRFIFRVPRALDRRSFLRLAGAGVAGLALWQASRAARVLLALPGALARFTGSYERGSFTGEFPAVSWILDNPPPIAPDTWRLVVDGAVARPLSLGYAELARAAAAVEATIDCTGGWYSTQQWRGVSLAQLLAMAGVKPEARSVTIEAVSGYSRRFALDRVPALLLATRVAGRPLTRGHGFPLRLVAPGYRGYDWVKWVVRVRVETTSERLQPPLPVQ